MSKGKDILFGHDSFSVPVAAHFAYELCGFLAFYMTYFWR